MTSVVVSVVIPAYKQADFLAATIRSVLHQTFREFELIVVNDASPDHTNAVVATFDDPRVRYITHDRNRGLPAARNTGMRAARGEYIALLDADDLFHPDKLGSHVEFYERHPDIAVTYNSRYALNYSSETIRELYRPPLTVHLTDLVLGYPFMPSDMVMRRSAALDVDLFDETYINGGEDLDFPCRLALAGYRFASIDRPLNFRRHHSGRTRRNISERLEDVFRSLEQTFGDSRCPAEVRQLRDVAYATNYLVYMWHALEQQRTSLASECAREAIRLDPSLLDGYPSKFVESLIFYSIADDSRDHERLLATMFAQLPTELQHLTQLESWAVGYGYLIKGTRAVIWDRASDGREYLLRAGDLGARLDANHADRIFHELLALELEFGTRYVEDIWRRLTTALQHLSSLQLLRKSRARYVMNRAFHSFQTGATAAVPRLVLEAVSGDFSYLWNRGALSILVRSLGRSLVSGSGEPYGRTGRVERFDDPRLS